MHYFTPFIGPHDTPLQIGSQGSEFPTAHLPLFHHPPPPHLQPLMYDVPAHDIIHFSLDHNRYALRTSYHDGTVSAEIQRLGSTHLSILPVLLGMPEDAQPELQTGNLRWWQILRFQCAIASSIHLRLETTRRIDNESASPGPSGFIASSGACIACYPVLRINP
ncbi:hypothetical protein C8R47DRAFT_1222265 [Mycena vitilis]|nr:hypothetical protein C8R47DRAFT_1222265 [Mycena vitilis]